MAKIINCRLMLCGITLMEALETGDLCIDMAFRILPQKLGLGEDFIVMKVEEHISTLLCLFLSLIFRML